MGLGLLAMPASKERAQYFRAIQTINLEYAPVTLVQYESSRTGMRVVVVDQVGPKVNGYFALATEVRLSISRAWDTYSHLVDTIDPRTRRSDVCH